MTMPNLMAHATIQEAEAVPNAERFRNDTGIGRGVRVLTPARPE